MNSPVLIFVTSFSGIREYPGPVTNGLRSDYVAQGTGVEGIEEPNENDDVERWVEVDSDPLAVPHSSNKDGAPAIAGMDNAELPNVE